ncbi:MAG: SgcJ/EcaC family oxidoreductase, partial [Gemmatimonadota bacterium]
MAMALDRTQLQEAIEAVNAQFMEAVRAGDAAAVAALYTDDAILLPPEAEIVQGLAALQEIWAADFADGGFTLNLTTVSVDGAGEFAYEIGTWSMPTGEGEGGAVEQGKYLVVWKRGADGSWKLHADIWNSSSPAE